MMSNRVRAFVNQVLQAIHSNCFSLETKKQQANNKKKKEGSVESWLFTFGASALNTKYGFFVHVDSWHRYGIWWYDYVSQASKIALRID
jgi:hypothetical protein